MYSSIGGGEGTRFRNRGTVERRIAFGYYSFHFSSDDKGIIFKRNEENILQ